jgi:hypothetical protein
MCGSRTVAARTAVPNSQQRRRPMGSKQIIREELLAAVHELHHGDVLLVRVPNERFNYQYVEEPDTRPAPRLPSSHRLASEAIRCTAGSRGNTSPTNTRCHRLSHVARRSAAWSGRAIVVFADVRSGALC